MYLKQYQEELEYYNIEVIKNSNFSRSFLEDNLINTANVVLLLTVERYDDGFIDVLKLNSIYDKIVTFVKNRDLLGDVKVFIKLMKIVDELHHQPFVATI